MIDVWLQLENLDKILSLLERFNLAFGLHKGIPISCWTRPQWMFSTYLDEIGPIGLLSTLTTLWLLSIQASLFANLALVDAFGRFLVAVTMSVSIACLLEWPLRCILASAAFAFKLVALFQLFQSVFFTMHRCQWTIADGNFTSLLNGPFDALNLQLTWVVSSISKRNNSVWIAIMVHFTSWQVDGSSQRQELSWDYKAGIYRYRLSCLYCECVTFDLKDDGDDAINGMVCQVKHGCYFGELLAVVLDEVCAKRLSVGYKIR